jgi:sugar O-acyltransferase (sialic acid O-acetyltransferase NeuD family)
MILAIYRTGKGGFGREVIDSARRFNLAYKAWSKIVFVDEMPNEASFYGAEVYRLKTAREKFSSEKIVGIAATGDPVLRKSLSRQMIENGIALTTLIDNTAVVSDSAKISLGSIISTGCFVSSDAGLGEGVALVAHATVGHDVLLGEYCTVSGMVNIGGYCTIGRECFIGMGAQLKDGIKVGRNVVVGMGSVVYADLPDQVVALGNPCRPMRPNLEEQSSKRGGDIGNNEQHGKI